MSVWFPVMCTFCPGKKDYYGISLFGRWFEISEFSFDAILNVRIQYCRAIERLNRENT